jgi:hypothetical protein
MDAGPMIGAAGHPSAPRPAVAAVPPAGPDLSLAGPTLSPAGPGDRADALSHAPTGGGEGIAAAPGTETAIPARSPAGRRPAVIAAVVVAVILVIILAIFVLPKMFHVYKSSPGLGPRPASPPAAAQLR